MPINSAHWKRVSNLFDELAPLTREQRAQWLQAETHEPEVLLWLDKLLKAHDARDSDLLDHSIGDIVDHFVELTPGTPTLDAEMLVGKTFGPWRALSELGRGGMGVVLKGERADGQFDKVVAIKVLPSQAVPVKKGRRLRSEIQLLASLEHPGIARLLDGGVDEEGNSYLVLDYVDGVSITRYCQERNLTVEKRMRLLMNVASAVSYSHQRLVVHCDIKPSNILVTDCGQVKLLDFGIAARLKEPPTQTTTDSAPFIRCTPGYASPEQLSGQPPSTAQDIYALGALMFELLTDRRLFNSQATIRGLAGLDVDVGAKPERRLKATNIEADLRAICACALVSDPAGRYASVQEFIADLESWVEKYPVKARNGGYFYRFDKWVRRYYWAGLAVGVATLAVFFGVGASLWQASEAKKFALIAQEQAERANIEQFKSEQALVRSQAVSQFLQELFLASRPDRPRQQLPTTEELLARGAARAVSPAIKDSGEQIELLLTLGNIYLDYHKLEDAQPLLDMALQLAREQPYDAGNDLARALLAQGRLAQLQGELEIAEQWLVEGEQTLTGLGDDWLVYLRLRTSRAWLQTLRANYEEAYSILKPLYVEASQRDDIPPTERFHILNGLALLYKQREEPDKALALHEMIDDDLKANDAPDSIRVAVNQANLGLLHYNLGNYQMAADATSQALDLLEQISPEPSSYRSTVRRYLAYSLLQSGQFDEGEQYIRDAAMELELLYGVASQEIPTSLFELGWIETRFRRHHEAAVEYLEPALGLLRPTQQSVSAEYIWTALLLARVRCQTGQSADGWQLLTELDELLQGKQPEAFQQQSELHETRAVCLFSEQRFELAIQELEQALSRSMAPGRAVERADCHVLMAKSLVALGQQANARRALEAAREVFITLDMPNHPHLFALQALPASLGLEVSNPGD